MAVILVGLCYAAFRADLGRVRSGKAPPVKMVLYLAYLRRQTRIEEKVRRRR